MLKVQSLDNNMSATDLTVQIPFVKVQSLDNNTNQLKACRGQIDKSEVKLVRRYLDVLPCKIIAS